MSRSKTWSNIARVIFDPNETVTTNDMLSRAGLANWNVRTAPVLYPDGVTSIDKSFYVLRDTELGVQNMAIVGDKYRVYQNEELLSFGDNLLDGGAKWESAGFFRGGRTIFGALTLDHKMVLDPSGANDVTETYLLVTTSHDGSSSIRACVTPVRVYCQNTLTLAIKKATQSWAVRHTQGTSGRIEEARQALKLTFDYMERFESVAQELFQTSITDAQFDKAFETVYPKPADDTGAKTTWQKKFDITRGLYLSASHNANIYGTAWGALNAMTERIDWFRNGDKPMTEGLSASASGLETSVQQEKTRILEAVQALA